MHPHQITQMRRLTHFMRNSKLHRCNTLLIRRWSLGISMQRLHAERFFMGPFGYGVQNDRESVLVEFVLKINLKVCNTFLKKSAHRKWTWRSPNGNVRNEIDYIITNRLLGMLDTEVVNRFNFYSDHRLIRSVLRVGRHRYSPRSPKSMKIIISAELQELFQLKLKFRGISFIQPRHPRVL